MTMSSDEQITEFEVSACARLNSHAWVLSLSVCDCWLVSLQCMPGYGLDPRTISSCTSCLPVAANTVLYIAVSFFSLSVAALILTSALAMTSWGAGRGNNFATASSHSFSASSVRGFWCPGRGVPGLQLCCLSPFEMATEVAT